MKTNGFILEGKALEKANRRFLIRFLGKEYYNWCFMDKLNYRRVSLIEMRYMVDEGDKAAMETERINKK